jgi:hypothetical protein
MSEKKKLPKRVLKQNARKFSDEFSKSFEIGLKAASLPPHKREKFIEAEKKKLKQPSWETEPLDPDRPQHKRGRWFLNDLRNVGSIFKPESCFGTNVPL